MLLFTVVAEGIGALVLRSPFWRSAAGDGPVVGVFHVITSFNNAGFDLTGGFRSMMLYQDAPLVLIPLSVLLTWVGSPTR